MSLSDEQLWKTMGMDIVTERYNKAVKRVLDLTAESTPDQMFYACMDFIESLRDLDVRKNACHEVRETIAKRNS